MKEVWKDIEGYDGLYQISSIGNVRSLNYNHIEGRVKNLRLVYDKNKYLIVCLSNKNRHKNYKVHRLVAEAFMPNPENNPEVNHKDGNKQNNTVGNLEWVTSKENQIHAYKTGLQKSKYGEDHHSSILISQYDLKGNFIKSYKGVCTAAKKLNINACGITACLRGRSKTAGGYVWKYAEKL